MTGSEPGDRQPASGPLRVDLAVEHPECWVIEVSEETTAGVLGRGVYRTGENRGNSHVTLCADRRAALSEAVEVARASRHTFSVAEMDRSPAHAVPAARGKATRDLLVEHDPSKQVSDAFVSRGFVYGSPVDIRDGVEHWTLLTRKDRRAIRTALDEVRDREAARIELVGVSEVEPRPSEGTLPLHHLSPRQREVFRLARERGYYAHPKEATASDLADALGVTTSTVHEHLHKAEQTLLDRS